MPQIRQFLRYLLTNDNDVSKKPLFLEGATTDQISSGLTNQEIHQGWIKELSALPLKGSFPLSDEKKLLTILLIVENLKDFAENNVTTIQPVQKINLKVILNQLEYLLADAKKLANSPKSYSAFRPKPVKKQRVSPALPVQRLPNEQGNTVNQFANYIDNMLSSIAKAEGLLSQAKDYIAVRPASRNKSSKSSNS